MSYEYVDGRGGAREGAGRPKATEVKKAFRVTEKEKDLIKKIRLLDDDGVNKFNIFFKSLFNEHRSFKW